MNISSQDSHNSVESSIAEKYRKKGFEVITNPQSKDLLFELGTYRPDLVVRKSKNKGYIIEVKTASAQISVGRYQEIASIISQQTGWRFLLITGDDAVSNSQDGIEGNLLKWGQIYQRKGQADRLISSGESEGAFLSLWVLFEALMRKRAEQIFLPIERIPTIPLIKHLYSQGELDMEQFDQALSLQNLRNQLIHGIEVLDLSEPIIHIQYLVDDLLKSWGPNQPVKP